MDIQSSYFCPKVIILQEEIKKCNGCLLHSNNFRSRRVARKKMREALNQLQQRRDVKNYMASIRSLGKDDLSNNQYKLHIYVTHESNHPNCYNYSIKIARHVKEIIVSSSESYSF